MFAWCLYKYEPLTTTFHLLILCGWKRLKCGRETQKNCVFCNCPMGGSSCSNLYKDQWATVWSPINLIPLRSLNILTKVLIKHSQLLCLKECHHMHLTINHLLLWYCQYISKTDSHFFCVFSLLILVYMYFSSLFLKSYSSVCNSILLLCCLNFSKCFDLIKGNTSMTNWLMDLFILSIFWEISERKCQKHRVKFVL